MAVALQKGFHFVKPGVGPPHPFRPGDNGYFMSGRGGGEEKWENVKEKIGKMRYKGKFAKALNYMKTGRRLTGRVDKYKLGTTMWTPPFFIRLRVTGKI